MCATTLPTPRACSRRSTRFRLPSAARSCPCRSSHPPSHTPWCGPLCPHHSHPVPPLRFTDPPPALPSLHPPNRVFPPGLAAGMEDGMPGGWGLQSKGEEEGEGWWGGGGNSEMRENGSGVRFGGVCHKPAEPAAAAAAAAGRGGARRGPQDAGGGGWVGWGGC
jgi:hypothetical protein